MRLTLGFLRPCSLSCVTVAVLGAALTLPHTATANPGAYGVVGTRPLPTATTAWDVDPSGRLLGVSGDSIVEESAPLSGSFSTLALLPLGSIASTGPAFLSISPSGQRIAVGDGRFDSGAVANARAFIVERGTLAQSSLLVPNYASRWTDNQTLYVSGGSVSGGSVVSRVNAPVAGSPVATAVVSGVGDGSGGLAISGGSLLVGSFLFSGGGDVRSFGLAALAGAASPSAFSSGSFITGVSSIAALDVDNTGTLIVAGFGGVTLIDPSNLSTYALPGLDPMGFYSARFDASMTEILVQNFGETTATRFAVPTPGACSLLALAGIMATRRRR